MHLIEHSDADVYAELERLREALQKVKFIAEVLIRAGLSPTLIQVHEVAAAALAPRKVKG